MGSLALSPAELEAPVAVDGVSVGAVMVAVKVGVDEGTTGSLGAVVVTPCLKSASASARLALSSARRWAVYSDNPIRPDDL